MNFNYFFTPITNIPSSLSWNLYGKGHLTWLFAIILFIFLMCKTFVKLDRDKQDMFLKGFAVLIVAQEILKDLIHFFIGTLEVGHLPLHLCGISIFITLWYAFRPSKFVGNLLYSLSLPGAMAALIFPDWTKYPFLHFSNINSFTIHTWLVMVVIVLLYSKRIVPDYKYLPKCLGFLGVLALPIYFLNKLWNTNFMFINTPSKGSPLEPLAKLLGNPGYIFGAVVLLIIVWVVMYLPYVIKDIKEVNIQNREITNNKEEEKEYA